MQVLAFKQKFQGCINLVAEFYRVAFQMLSHQIPCWTESFSVKLRKTLRILVRKETNYSSLRHYQNIKIKSKYSKFGHWQIPTITAVQLTSIFRQKVQKNLNCLNLSKYLNRYLLKRNDYSETDLRLGAIHIWYPILGAIFDIPT